MKAKKSTAQFLISCLDLLCILWEEEILFFLTIASDNYTKVSEREFEKTA